MRKNHFGIIGPQPGEHPIQSVEKKTGKILWNVTYNIDPWGRRIVPIENKRQPRSFILFFGCSYTYGEGVNDDQTMPYFVGKSAPDYLPYIYAFTGDGPFDALAKLQHRDLAKEIEPRQGILIYTFIDDHILRVIGSRLETSYRYGYPYYVKNKAGRLQRKGNFTTGRPVISFLYQLLNKSQLMQALHVDIPLRITNNHIKLTALAFEEIFSAFKMKYPEGKMYLLFYPGSKFSEKIKSNLINSGILFLDYSKLFSDPANPKYHLAPEDSHPSPLAYKLIAEKIALDLMLK